MLQSLMHLLILVLSPVAIAGSTTANSNARMSLIPGGIYRPTFPTSPGENEVKVSAFWLDQQPVTNAEFLQFVYHHPKWQKGSVKRLFADHLYLAHWTGPLALGRAPLPDAPVVHVSWFAAKAYCEARGARLPLEREWELAAIASHDKPQGMSTPEMQQQILSWYARPNPPTLGPVKQSPANFYGVWDMHGLIWEWVYDYSAALVAVGDNREQGDDARNKFCGAGAATATNPADYAAFMRLAFRASLQAGYTTPNLGFRCAKDATDARQP